MAWVVSLCMEAQGHFEKAFDRQGGTEAGRGAGRRQGVCMHVRMHMCPVCLCVPYVSAGILCLLPATSMPHTWLLNTHEKHIS